MTSQNNKKMGRPPKGESKQLRKATTHITAEEDFLYKEYCKQNNTTVAEDLREYIYSKIKK